MTKIDAQRLVLEAVTSRQAVDPFVDQGPLRAALAVLKTVDRPITKQMLQGITMSKLFEDYKPDETLPVVFGKKPISPTMTWKEFAAVLGSKVPWVLHKMLNGMETSYFSFLLAQGHTTRVRGSIYLSIADRKKTERRHQWATVVTDQLTGQGYHIEGADCGLQYDGRATTCFCDALAWKLTAVEMKAYAQKGKADLAAWDLTLGNAVIIKDDKVFRIVDGRFFRDGREEALTFDEGELFDYGEEYNGYATKEIAESVLKDARDHRALEIKTAA